MPYFVAGEFGREHLTERRCSVFAQTARELTGGIAVELAAGRIRHAVLYLGPPQGYRVHIGRVAAPVLDENRMAGRGGIQIFPVQLTTLRGLGIVVLEANHPFARRCFRRSRADRALNFRNRAQIAIHPSQVPYTRI